MKSALLKNEKMEFSFKGLRFGLCLKRKNGILLKLLIFRRMEELRKAKPDFILNEVPFSSSPFLFKGLRFERSLLGGKVPC